MTINARIRLWAISLLAILAGNAVYFWGLVPVLPLWLVHQPFRLDPGVFLDLVCCVAVFALLRAAALRVSELLHR